MIDFDALVVGPTIAIFGAKPSDPVNIWYRPDGQQPLRLTAVFDEGAKQMLFNASTGEQTSDVRPLLGIRLSDLTDKGITPKQGDKVTIKRADGIPVDYQVSDFDPDGQGGAKITLNQLAIPK